MVGIKLRNKPIKVGTVVHTNDKYFQGSDGYSKNREAVIVGLNGKKELVLVKLTTSSNPKYKQVPGYKEGSKYMTESLYILDNEGKRIKISNVQDVTDEYKFIRSRFPDVSESAVQEILKVVLNDRKYGMRNTRRYSQVIKKGSS